jgi:colanic acid biosynthesis glycosyl transferase WcaI
MRVILLSMNFAPELTGVGKYSGEMANALVDRGHEVVVVCTPPFYPRWSLAEGHLNRYRTERPRAGLTILRCPVWLPQRLRASTRILHLLSFSLTSAPVLLGLVIWRADVVFAVAPAMPSVPFAWLSARLARAKAWLHIQDFELEAAHELGMIGSGPLFASTRAAERQLLRAFDVVSTISSRMLMRLAIKGVDMHRTTLLPNWVERQLSREVDAALPLRQALGIGDDRIVCLYSGTINRKQGLPVLIEAARRLAARPQILILICGNGEQRSNLEDSARGLDNVLFLDLQPAASFPRLLATADIHLLPQLRGAADLVMPSKLAAMMASGRPVIAAADPGTQLAKVLRDVGVLTRPECADGFAKCIGELADDVMRRRELGAAARAYAESHLDAELIFDRLDRQLSQVARDRLPVAISELA